MEYGIILGLFIVLLLPGIVMSFIPALPGLLYMLFISALFGVVTKFLFLDYQNLAILAGIAISAMIIDVVAGMIGAKYGGARWKSLFGGFAGLVVGTLIIPVPVIGSLLGFFVGIFASEIAQHRTKAKAMKAATGGLIGFITGTIGNVILSVVFFITFIFFALY